MQPYIFYNPIGVCGKILYEIAHWRQAYLVRSFFWNTLFVYTMYMNINEKSIIDKTYVNHLYC